MYTIIFIGVPFLKGICSYSNKSEGPKLTEKQVRLADQAAEIFDNCHPIQDVIDPQTHMAICKALQKEKFLESRQALEHEIPSLTKKGWCVEVLRIGVWLLGGCSPQTIRDATFNLLACDSSFPLVSQQTNSSEKLWH